MPRTTWTYGRRGAAVGASAAVVCLSAALAACGSTGEGYVAVGPAGGTPTAVKPTGGVRVVPLEETPTGNSPTHAGASKNARPRTPSAGQPSDTESGRTTPSSPSATPTAPRTTPTTPPTTAPAALTWGDPVRAATDQRWCEDVTLVFRNSGGAAVRSGTVGFGTHIIGTLGVDWGTVESQVGLPAPIEGGARKERTWTVCVEAWRVPLGMHIETRDVDVRWE
ncbi:hypothetical protein OG885_23540 [Streptomyces sp. NBC_00028]|uniref:hypothetical protein n=1 Tax=Streptomyces sp. NBC_00028 TaxID=2975624 RepID=UPI0032559F0E